mgnify:CR=1 FL=1
MLDNRRWDFDAGHMVLDFANTVEFHASSQPDEYLLTYADLIAWSLDAGLLSEVEAGQLLAAAQEQPQEAERMLQQAIALGRRARDGRLSWWGLPRGGAQDFRSETGHVIARGQGGGLLDETAGQPEKHRPEAP